MAAPASTPATRRNTPAMRQFARFKAEHPDCLLFFRMGDFYETFDDDAVTAHRALGITLTQRSEGIPMAGVPYHAIEGYLRKLIRQGYRVAVADQIQDPKDAKGVVDRAVTRVLTPGTLVDDDLLEASQSNFVAAVHLPAGGPAVLATAELSTGVFTVAETPRAQLLDELARLGPRELLYAEPDSGGPMPETLAAAERALDCAMTPRPAWTFRLTDARDLLCDHYGVRQLDGFGLAADDPALAPAGALLRYLRETQPGHDAKRPLAHLRPPRRRTSAGFVAIDAATLRSLEIEKTMRGDRTDGSVLGGLQSCTTPMGRRLLRQWLCFPLRDRAAIEARQHAVAATVADETLRDQLLARLGDVQDVARIGGRLGLGRATPRDLVALGRSLKQIPDLAQTIDGAPAFAETRNRLGVLDGTLTPLAASIAESCVDDPPAHMREGGLFRDGYDTELDEARVLQRDASKWLARYQQQLIESTGIPSLKVGYNKVFGYYIEVTHVHTDKVPDTLTRKQTLKNAERYITQELKEFESKVMTADARAIEREKTLFEQLCVETATHSGDLADFADLVASLDVLVCFAELAVRRGYVRPTLVDEPVLDITAGRHPVLDRLLEDRFVPNDCVLGGGDEGGDRASGTLAIITGPNMAGKSTYIRQVALIALLAHTGCFVPAEAATVGMVDRIFTRVGASDELHAGQSTFMVEMTETANILHHATARSLVILDEIGRGTSTLDGLSLAWAIAETIADRGCRTLFATHYHELTSLADRLDNVINLHVSVREWGEEVIFLHRILPGRTDRSYGIHVARIAGLPPDTVRRASELLETLAVQTEGSRIAGAPPPTARGDQLGLFAAFAPHPAVDTLAGIEITTLTPMDAFDQLRALVEQVKDAGTP